MKKFIDLFFLGIISVVTLFIWHPLTKTALQSESYTYLLYQGYKPLFDHSINMLANFDVQAIVTGYILGKIFGLDMVGYFWTEIMFILLTNITLYLLVKELTSNKTTAFVSSFIFSMYFFGIGFFLPNWYATFIQRVIFNAPLLLLSWLFLHKFLNGREKKYLFISILCYFLSIFLSQFGILISFPILLYPLFWVASTPKRKLLPKGLVVIFPYIGIIFFFLTLQKLWGENIVSQRNLLDFLLHPQKYPYIEGFFRQLSYMSQYPTVIKALNDGLYALAHSDAKSTFDQAIPITGAYILAFFITYRLQKSYRPLLFTVTASFILSLVTNIFLNRFDVFQDAHENRYYYYPSMLMAIFWGLFLTSFFRRGAIIISCILFGYFFVNFILFKQFFADQITYSIPTKRLYEYALSNIDKISDNNFVIIGPSRYFGPYENAFLNEYLVKNKNIIFKTEDISYGDWRPEASNSAHVTTILFDEKCACVKKSNLW